MKPTTIHRTYEKQLTGPRETCYYVSDGETTKKWTAKEFTKWLDKPSESIRLTAAHSADALVGELVDRGVKVFRAHWHDMDIPKNETAEAIALAVAQAPDLLFREVLYRRDIAELRNALDARNAVLHFYGDAVRRLKQIGRNVGVADGEETANGLLKDSFDELDKLHDVMKVEQDSGRSVSLDTHVSKLAAKIPECVLFNEIADIKGSWITAASIVSYCGDIHRFPQVASLWHYLGQHVVEGKAPARRVGNPVTWSPKGRTAVYLMGDSIIKNRRNKWRPFYEEAREIEKLNHLDKHPGCKTIEGHCTARAKRKMCKEILKQFFIQATGIEDYRGHTLSDNQLECAAV